MVCNSQSGTDSLGLAASGYVFNPPLAKANGLAPEHNQSPPSIRNPTPELTTTGH